VIVPFAEGRESEQGLRGRLLAERGILQLIDPDSLTADRLVAAIDRAAAPTELALDLDGAAGTARLLLEAVMR